MKIYISGQITGLPEQVAQANFSAAVDKIREWNHEPVNPFWLPHFHDKSWLNYMREDIKALLDCEAIYMLPNWNESQGAKIELSIAIQLGMKIIFE